MFTRVTSGLVLQIAQQGSGQADLLFWALLLIGLALLLFFLELVVPSGGIIGLFSAISLIAGVVMLFRIDTTLGLIGAIVALGSVPFLFGFALKVWPHTPIARRLTLGDPDAQNVAADMGGGSAAAGADGSLLGKTGRALTDLRPVGTCLIDGHRMDCMADTGLIRSGATVRVVTCDGLQLKVKQDDQDQSV